MATTKKTLNPMTDTPENKIDITKPFMLAYMECEKATVEDVIWFSEITNNPAYRKMYTNRLTNEPYEDIDIPKVRELFCKRFYPNLNQKKKDHKTFDDKLKEILEKKKNGK